MRVAVINASSNVYNLAIHRIANYHRQLNDTVDIINGHGLLLPDIWNADKYYFSAIFTWDLPGMINTINLVKGRAEVEVGGPAATAMPQYIQSETGVIPHIGLDERFEHVAGDDYRAVFTSRGCIRKCPWCVVSKVEPIRLEYEDFPIPTGKNPFIMDNCILATSWKHQKLVVDKMKDVRRLDINSGFDCRLFFEEHYQLYSKLYLEGWRLAFDSMGVEKEFERAVGILKKHGIDYRRILVYVLIGYPGTTFEECVYRLEKTRALDCSPYPQKYAPLDMVDAGGYVAPGFDKRELDMLRTYWCNPFAWRTCSWEEFIPQYRRLHEEQKSMGMAGFNSLD